MDIAICTLFEGHYHFGVAALTNSLYKNGFQGAIYAGYRGELPSWAAKAKLNDALTWTGAKTFKVAEGLCIHFLPVDTVFHLTNYKPYFMIQLINGPAKQADGIAYFDPDIIVKCNWRFFEKWITLGVSVVHEITANDMPPTHPIRLSWEQVIEKCNRKTSRPLYSYINGGYCGILKANYDFIYLWAEILDVAIQHYNLQVAKFMPTDRTNIFFASDQDALNIAAMCSKSPISEVGPDGMDFIPGGWIMSHAVGSPKPWKKNFISSFIRGIVPSTAEKGFWNNTKKPIRIYSPTQTNIKTFSIAVASFLGRTYRKY